MTTPTFPAAPRDLVDGRRHRREMATVVNRINSGKFNATGEMTLRASETTTVLTDPRLTPTSYVDLMPLTSAASSEPVLYAAEADRERGVWTFTHVSAAGTDRTFRFVVIG